MYVQYAPWPAASGTVAAAPGTPVDRHPLLAPEVVVGEPADAQPRLPLATEGVQRWVWQGRFGPILIEVIDDTPYVNGERVESCHPTPAPGGRPSPRD